MYKRKAHYYHTLTTTYCAVHWHCHTLPHTAAHCRAHCRRQPRAMPHTTSYGRTAARCRTGTHALPHTAALLHGCTALPRTLLHTIKRTAALLDSRTLPRALPYTTKRTATHYRAHGRTLPHCQTAASSIRKFISIHMNSHKFIYIQKYPFKFI